MLHEQKAVCSNNETADKIKQRVCGYEGVELPKLLFENGFKAKARNQEEQELQPNDTAC